MKPALVVRAALWLIARIVPARTRARWVEEWRAELEHAPRMMLLGALPDAWALRRLPIRHWSGAWLSARMARNSYRRSGHGVLTSLFRERRATA